MVVQFNDAFIVPYLRTLYILHVQEVSHPCSQNFYGSELFNIPILVAMLLLLLTNIVYHLPFACKTTALDLGESF